MVVAISPAIISALTGAIKQFPTFSEARASRRPLIRALAAFVSLMYIMIGYWLYGGDVDGMQVTELLGTIAASFVAWLASLGFYHGVVKKD